MSLFDRFRRKPKQKGWVSTDQGMMNTSWDWGWWQQDLKPLNNGMNETVEACVSTLAQTAAMCPLHLLEDQGDGELKRLTGRNPERVLLSPNDYTTRSLFFNNIIRSVYFNGNGYAIATRDGNRAVSKLYTVDPRNVRGVIDPESGDAYYWISPNQGQAFNPDTDQVYPSRDVLNIRLHTKWDEPLKGETPITVAAKAIAANSAIVGHQAAFFNNMSRPSGGLSTDQQLNKEQMAQLRQAWEEQSKGLNSGGVPILSNGLKWETMSLSSQDAQLVEAFGMTVESIARVFRVPMSLIGSMEGATFNNAETLSNWFLSSGMGFLLDHIELELNRLFSLDFNQTLNFDTTVLLRSDMKTKIEALGEGVLKGIYSPNEARRMMGLGAVKDGEEPRVQQQVVPLSAWDQPANDPVVEEEPEPVDVEAAFNKGFTSER